MGRCKDENAAYLRQLRAKAKAEGKCSICRARNARPGLATCQAHLKSNAEYANAHYHRTRGGAR
jgi:hypothetical protein